MTIPNINFLHLDLNKYNNCSIYFQLPCILKKCFVFYVRASSWLIIVIVAISNVKYCIIGDDKANKQKYLKTSITANGLYATNFLNKMKKIEKNTSKNIKLANLLFLTGYSKNDTTQQLLSVVWDLHSFTFFHSVP